MKRRLAFAKRHIWGALIASGALSTVLACRDPIPFTSPQYVVSNAATTPTWYGTYPLDLGDTRDSTQPSFYNTNAAFYAPATAQSFGAFHLEFAGSFGTMVGSFFDGSHFRPLGRLFFPYSQKGGGWAGYGPYGSFLNTSDPANPVSAENALYITMGLSPSGVGLVVFADGGTTGNTANAALQSSGNWAGISAQLGGSLIPTTLPGKGYVPLSNAQAGSFANGSTTSLAWDNNSHAYYSFVDQSSANFVSYVDRYTAFTSWQGPASNGTRLGPLTGPVQTLGDGYGVTPLWVGEDMLVASSVSLGMSHGCAVTPKGPVCWGNNGSGQTGTGSTVTNPVPYPAQVGGTGGTVVTVSAGQYHTCALTAAGSLLCWGQNSFGQVGIGIVSASQSSPSNVSGVPTPVKSVAAGGNHTCAIGSDNRVYCWGLNGAGQIGQPVGVPPSSATPMQVPAFGAANPIQLVGGNNHTCALLADNTVWCWGAGTSGQLGNGAGATSAVPVMVTGTNAANPAIGGVATTSFADTTCLLTNTPANGGGLLYCWGYNLDGEVGDGTNLNKNSPVQIGVLNYFAVSPGGLFTCALDSTNVLWCWGRNTLNQLGSGAASPQLSPTLVSYPSGITPTSIASGANTACSISNQGTTLCWGDNGSKEANGNSAAATVPAPLEIPASANQALHATWSAIPNLQALATLSTGDVKSMSSATDGNGNVVSVFLQRQPGFVQAPSGSIVTPYPVRHNDVRVYASVRGASGIWSGPTQIDDDARFVPATTTVYQEAWGRDTLNPTLVTGGIEYYTPAVAYLGAGRFLAAFAMTDLVNSTSSIYVRGYTVGMGWDPASQTYLIDSMKLTPSTTTEAYRYANDLAMVGDGQGDALLMAQVVVPSGDGSNITLRNLGMKAYVYSSSQGGWGSSGGFLFPGSLCRASSTTGAVIPFSAPPGSIAQWPAAFCWNLKPQGMIFPGGEAVVVFPAPAGPTGTPATQLRLYTSELHL